MKTLPARRVTSALAALHAVAVVVAPAHAAGTCDVVVTDAGGSATSTGGCS